MSSFRDYKVKDISLAEFGRQEILLAQDEMPALMQLREKYYIQCFDKKVFEKVSDAQKHVKNQQKYYKTKSRIYQCKICGNYHITTKFK